MQVLTIKKLREMLDRHELLAPNDIIAFSANGIVFGDSLKKTYPNVNDEDVGKILSGSKTMKDVFKEAQQIDTLRMYQSQIPTNKFVGPVPRS